MHRNTYGDTFEREHLEELRRFEAAEFPELSRVPSTRPPLAGYATPMRPTGLCVARRRRWNLSPELTVQPSSATAVVMASAQLFTY